MGKESARNDGGSPIERMRSFPFACCRGVFMTLKKCLSFVSLLCIISAQPVFSQETKVTQVPRTTFSDPFELNTGSSFAASGSDPRYGPSRKPAGVTKETVASDFEAALDIVKKNHADAARLNTERLTNSAIKSMLKMLDPHSNFYDANDYLNLLGEHESEYSGTGSSIAGYFRNGTLETYVVSTFPGSPAAKAGLRYGDQIIAVGGQNVSGRPPDAVRDLVRGTRGTVVRLRIVRADDQVIETVELRRDRVHEPAVPAGFLIAPGVGYIDLTAGFSNATLTELEAALRSLNRQGMNTLVLDIRGNGGGILDAAVKVAEKFLPAGSTVVTQRGRQQWDTRVWKATRPKYETMPLVLLVDENSASASEVLAGALQDNDRALIVGQKTFGKGLVQSVLGLPNGAGLTLTAARYYTPSGRSIQRDYSHVGLYDYFNHRNTVEIGRSTYAAKTITNRIVYGGDGITPDEMSSRHPVSPAQIELLDPLFFFAREYANGRIKIRDEADQSQLPQLRRKIVFGEDIIPEGLIDRFAEFIAAESSWKIDTDSLNRERIFIADMLRYDLAMAAFGTESANRSRIEADPEVRQAIAALPKAARLAAAAQKARSAPLKEKSPLSLVLSEQR
jgi:carboxyl-terminal processing protease